MARPDKGNIMKAWKLGGILTCMAVSGGQPAFAQTPAVPSTFVDAAIMVDRDQSDYQSRPFSYYGSADGGAARWAIGRRLSDTNGFQFEIDVPQWRATDRDSSAPVYCSSTNCPGAPGLAPAHTTDHTALRTISYSFLFARHLPAIPAVRRLRLAILAGVGIEEQDSQESGVFDQLGPDGKVVRHTSYARERADYLPAAVVGVDAEMKITSHLAVTPQFRFHAFPYPIVSIVRPGIALRWRF
jgi:hypothetical protein